MPNCKRTLDALSEYLDGYLSETRKELIDSHLSQCPNCQQVFNDVRHVKASLSQLPTIRTGSYFKPVLISKIKRAEKNARHSGWYRVIDFRSPIYIASTAVIILLTLIFIKPYFYPRQAAVFTNQSAENELANSSNFADQPVRVIAQTVNVVGSSTSPASHTLTGTRDGSNTHPSVSMLEKRKNDIIYF